MGSASGTRVRLLHRLALLLAGAGLPRRPARVLVEEVAALGFVVAPTAKNVAVVEYACALPAGPSVSPPTNSLHSLARRIATNCQAAKPPPKPG
jgi:hypothetical protein